MKECSFFEKDGIGESYATREARAILNREDTGLSDDERALRDRLLAFEEHFLTCDACLTKVREYQDTRTVFRRLGENASGVSQRRTRPGAPPRWLAVAASLLLTSTVVLTVWVAWLTHRAGGAAGGPQTVTGIYELKPASPSQRAAGPWRTAIPSPDTSFLLAVQASRTETVMRRYVVTILDGDKRELFRDDDAPVDPSGKLFVHVGSNFLAPGAYSLEVQAFSRQDGEALATASFPFNVDGIKAKP